ncbi:NAD(P)H-binding protein [Jidongwangia harbinensis]|uniref:NAD(P)H-binding protein n=1 Tax=Jidongwangia harbinensis TaxID=2878561 RepID=UPI001CD9886D|nr:NAD(P)H-binding protein [Jidongwangia harbinensis]MCA2215264.1 NAD(P)H-binding protein [Jidongwangia harbinensis]
MILITGATGTIGRELVRHLAAEGVPVRALTRDPARLADRPGVQVVPGDFADPGSLARAADGVSAVFLLSTGPGLPAHDEAMVRAAVGAGVRRLVKLSTMVTDEPALRLAAWHRPGEAAVRESGLDWTVLRPSTFASNALQWAGPIRAGRPVANLSGTGTQGFVDPVDVAAVAAAALTGGGHGGRTYTLTGPDLLTVPDQAAVLAGVLGRPVRTEDVPPERAREYLLGGGTPPEWVDLILEGSGYVAAGGVAVLTDDVATVLGRPPRSFREWAERHRSAFG